MYSVTNGKASLTSDSAINFSASSGERVLVCGLCLTGSVFGPIRFEFDLSMGKCTWSTYSGMCAMGSVR